MRLIEALKDHYKTTSTLSRVLRLSRGSWHGGIEIKVLWSPGNHTRIPRVQFTESLDGGRTNYYEVEFVLFDRTMEAILIHWLPSMEDWLATDWFVLLGKEESNAG